MMPNGKYIFESEKNTNISITATGYPQVDGTVTAPIRYQYVLMNIPYAEFYANESENNTIEADAVSSATKKKPLNKSMTVPYRTGWKRYKRRYLSCKDQ